MKVTEILDKRNKLQKILVSLTSIKGCLFDLNSLVDDKDEKNNFKFIEKHIVALNEFYEGEFEKLGNIDVAM